MAITMDLATTLAQLRSGDHLCYLYATEAEHRTVLSLFIEQGLLRTEKVLYFLDYHTADEILTYLRGRVPDLATRVKRGQLAFLNAGETYLPDAHFAPENTINLLRQATFQAQTEGYTALRVTGEMSWALRGLPGSEQLIEYEAKVNQFFEHFPCLAICQYDRRRFNESVLLGVLETHPLAIVGTEVFENLYYAPPDELLRADRARLQLTRWLQRLKERRQLDQQLANYRLHLEEQVAARTRELEETNRQLQHEIEERQRTEAALRESEEKYRRLVENAREAIYVAQEGRIVFANKSSSRLLNLDKIALSGRRLEEFVRAEDRAVILEHHQRFLADPQAADTIERRIVSASGEEYWLLINAVHITWNGQPATLNLASDITERKRSEQILQARVRLAQYAGDHTLHELLVATLDEAGELTDSPIGFYHFLDADQKTLTLQAWSTRTTAEFCTAEGEGRHYSLDMAGVWVDCVRERRAVIHNDYAALPHRRGLPPGHAVVTRELVVPVFRGDLIVAILGVGNKPRPYGEHDLAAVSLLADLAWEIAERKQMTDAEHDQRVLAEALRDTATALNSTLNLDEVFDRVLLNVGRVVPHDAVSLTLLDEQQVTARVARYHGYAEAGTEAVVGRLQFELAETQNLKIQHETRQPLVIADTRQFAGWVTGPGREWIRSYAGVPIYDRERVVGFVNLYSRKPDFYSGAHAERLQAFADQVAVALQNAQLHARSQQHADELELRVAERTRDLMTANERLTELDRLKDEFISRISHELRTPLTSIRIYLDLLANGKAEKRGKYLQILNEQSERLQGLIESLLDVSQLTVSGEVNTVPMDLNRVARELADGYQAQAQKRGQILATDLTPELPMVKTDSLLLVQALSNIMTNALAYTPPSGRITVMTSWQTANERSWATLTVRDTGPGISAEDLPHIFDRFYRGTAARDYTTPGTGLGLTISQAIVTRLGGRLTVASVPGEGAAFTVWLPIASD